MTPGDQRDERHDADGDQRAAGVRLKRDKKEKQNGIENEIETTVVTVNGYEMMGRKGRE